MLPIALLFALVPTAPASPIGGFPSVESSAFPTLFRRADREVAPEAPVEEEEAEETEPTLTERLSESVTKELPAAEDAERETTARVEKVEAEED